MSYRVSTQVFSGPFDLLLTLVSRQRLDIAAIPIAELTDQFLAELDRMKEMDLEVTSDFLQVAAALLDIKAAHLVSDAQDLPALDADDDFALLDPDDARDVLSARLITYRQFRNVSVWLRSRAAAEARMHPRTAGPDPEFCGLMPDFLKGITLRSLGVICADLDSRREEFLLEAEHIAPKRLPVHLVVESVERSMRNERRQRFSELVGAAITPENIVVTFLAVLELFKREVIHIHQEENFADIELEYVGDVSTGSTVTGSVASMENAATTGSAATTDSTSAAGSSTAKEYESTYE